MKILQVANSFKYAWSSGGVARVAYDMSVALTKRGHKVTVFSTDKGLIHSCNFEKNHPVDIDGIETYYFSNFSNILAKTGIAIPYYSLFVIGQKKKEFDIIHIHEPRRIINVLIYFYAKKYQIPYVFQAHGALPPSTSFSKRAMSRIFDYLFFFRLLRDASKVIALTRTEAHQYLNMGVPKSKIVIIPNGIDLSEYANLPPKGSFKKKYAINGQIVLFLGRINRIKGIDVLVKAFKQIVNAAGNVKLVIVGPDDGYLGEIEALTKALQIEDKVLVLGPLYGMAKLEAYVDADMYVLPSRYEIFGMTVLEAYACGKPVIASNVESMSDIVLDGITGFLFEANDVKRLAELLLYVLSNEKEAEKMGQMARKFVERNFLIERVADSLEVLFKNILEQ